MRYTIGRLLEQLFSHIPAAVGAVVVVGLLIFGLVQVVSLVRSYRRYAREREGEARAERGLCPNCGYNCNESDRLCSECGEKNPVYYRKEIREFLSREASAGEPVGAEVDDDGQPGKGP